MNLYELDAQALDRLYRDRTVSPVEVVQACLARHRDTHAHLNALCHVDAAGALRAAHEAAERQRRGQRRGPLDGVPFTVKDNLFAGGLPATWGSRLYADFVPAADDLVVARLRAAGACLLGKTNTPELALAGRTDNLLFGATRNPVDLHRTPGGSSGGAAASTAAGVAPLAVATDAGGSTRLPASYTGLFGLRPSTGRIPRQHGFPALAADFQVIGLLARSLEDIATVLAAVAGADPHDRLSQGLPAARVGSGRIRCVERVDDEPVDPQVRAELRAVAARLAAGGLAVADGPAPFDLAQVRAIWASLSSVGVARAFAGHAAWRGRVSPDLERLADAGAALDAVSYLQAIDEVQAMRAAVEARFGDDEFILTPTAAVLPWAVDQAHVAQIDGRPGSPRSAAIFATWVNACGLPALSLPIGLSADGLPVGVQVVARFGADEALLRLARAVCAICAPPRRRFESASGPRPALIRYERPGAAPAVPPSSPLPPA